MKIPSSTQKKFYLENDVGNSLEDVEVTSPEDKDHEEDGSRTIPSNKVMVTKTTKHIPSSKVTRGTNKDGTNHEETSEVKQTLEEDLTEDTTDLGTHWTLAIML